MQPTDGSPSLPERRDFLRQAGGVITGLLAAGSPLAALAPSRAWAIDLANLTSKEGATLMAMLRTIAPHDRLEDVAYAFVAKAIDGKAGPESGRRADLKAGLAQLNADGDFSRLDESRRVAVLRRIENTAFFQGVRVDLLMTLYDTPQAAALFGYEGETFSKGGYLYRGFNELKWLPDPPLADSGPMPA